MFIFVWKIIIAFLHINFHTWLLNKVRIHAGKSNIMQFEVIKKAVYEFWMFPVSCESFNVCACSVRDVCVCDVFLNWWLIVVSVLLLQDRIMSQSTLHARGRDMFGLCCLPGETHLSSSPHWTSQPRPFTPRYTPWEMNACLKGTVINKLILRELL